MQWVQLLFFCFEWTLPARSLACSLSLSLLSLHILPSPSLSLRMSGLLSRGLIRSLVGSGSSEQYIIASN